jgi:uncharacterized membrane-anchored protein YitT (DUF2179 family)
MYQILGRQMDRIWSLAKVGYAAKRFILVILGSVLMAVNIKTFCAAAGIIPGGFTGITILFNEVMSDYYNIKIPFSVVYYILNAIPAYIGFRYIGKWFSVYSILAVFLTGILADWVPSSLVTYLHLQDNLLCAVFGGIINAFAISLCLFADATSGGTDFIAIYFAQRRGKDAWGIIFAANCVVLLIAAFLYEPGKALYSIIFQFATTMGLNGMYKGYQQKTLLIITENPEEVYKLIRDITNHDATSFTGTGLYEKANRTMLYSVVASNDVQPLIIGIKKIDKTAFINVLKTDFLNGRFYRRPKN